MLDRGAVTSHERLHDDQVIFAHTSPVYVDVKGRPFRPDTRSGTVTHSTQVKDMLDWTWNRGPKAATARPERLAEVLTARATGSRTTSPVDTGGTKETSLP